MNVIGPLGVAPACGEASIASDKAIRSAAWCNRSEDRVPRGRLEIGVGYHCRKVAAPRCFVRLCKFHGLLETRAIKSNLGRALARPGLAITRRERDISHATLRCLEFERRHTNFTVWAPRSENLAAGARHDAV